MKLFGKKKEEKILEQDTLDVLKIIVTNKKTKPFNLNVASKELDKILEILESSNDPNYLKSAIEAQIKNMDEDIKNMQQRINERKIQAGDYELKTVGLPIYKYLYHKEQLVKELKKEVLGMLDLSETYDFIENFLAKVNKGKQKEAVVSFKKLCIESGEKELTLKPGAAEILSIKIDNGEVDLPKLKATLDKTNLKNKGTELSGKEDNDNKTEKNFEKLMHLIAEAKQKRDVSEPLINRTEAEKERIKRIKENPYGLVRGPKKQ